jgi:4-hydroxy-tetrahydrodipicolinate synthase
MKPLQAKNLKGNWATLLLPLEPDESIDFDRLDDQITVLVRAGVSGIYTNGTAGEFYAQSESEFDRIHEMVSEQCELHQIPFQIGATHMSPQIALERIHRSKALSPGAFQVILADWFPLTLPEAIDCLSRMASVAAPIGLVLYNPPHAKLRLSPSDFGKITRAVPELIGIKVAGGDASWYGDMREQCPGLAIFVPGHQLATGLTHGAAGSYSNVACLHPVGAQRWYELMKTDVSQALALEGRIQSFFSEYIRPLIQEQGYANHAVDKLLAAIGRWSNAGTRLRWPYRWIPEREADRLRPVALEMIPELFPDAWGSPEPWL